MSTAPYVVYILRCGDGTLYTGITNDLDRRVLAHGAGRASRYTRCRLPVRVVYTEKARSRSAALKREMAIKKLTRARKTQLINQGPSSGGARAPRRAISDWWP
jgi:predicted GIY-YIG superfamily endonuclease